MLTKRTNILFNEQIFQFLADLAKKRDTSIGELVRIAVMKVYFNKELVMQRQKAYKEILALKKGFGPISGKQIRELITYGRRF